MLAGLASARANAAREWGGLSIWTMMLISFDGLAYCKGSSQAEAGRVHRHARRQSGSKFSGDTNLDLSDWACGAFATEAAPRRPPAPEYLRRIAKRDNPGGDRGYQPDG